MGRSRSASHSRWSALICGFASFVMVLAFQNCGGFKTTQETDAASAAGGLEKFRLTVFDAGGDTIDSGKQLDGGTEYRLEGAGPDLPVTVSWVLLTNSGNCVLSSKAPGTSIRYITCVNPGKVQIQSTAYWQDGTISRLVTEHPTSSYISDACGTNLSTRRVFRISNGTGNGAWNTAANPLIVSVGQTIRICNTDSVTHQFRSAGTPCASQPSPMSNLQYYDCVVANSTGLASGGPADGTFTDLYDQLSGPSAAFYVKPFNGQQLYADTSKTSSGQSCVSCHGQFSTSEKRGASFTGLKQSILGNRGGMGVYNGRISDDELRAITFSLNQ